jgi:alkyldihydroxyacetonephosphate synthase
MTTTTADLIAIDPTSLLVGTPASCTLDGVETALAARGFTLGVALAGRSSASIGDWLAAGAPGAPSMFADPADHVVAGLLATLPNGKELEIRPGPRRAVGPDLTALVLGTNHHHLATVTHAWLRIHRLGARRPSMPLPATELDPPMSEEEAGLVEAIRRELMRP